jgi:hypothetical protein
MVAWIVKEFIGWEFENDQYDDAIRRLGVALSKNSFALWEEQNCFCKQQCEFMR